MRKTGKLYSLTLVSAALCILASVLVASWNEKTSTLHLWLDIVPQGFGMASLITTTLSVSISPSIVLSPYARAMQAMIAGVHKEDMAVATGSEFRLFTGVTNLMIHIIQSHIYFAQRVKFLELVCQARWSRAYCFIN